MRDELEIGIKKTVEALQENGIYRPLEIAGAIVDKHLLRLHDHPRKGDSRIKEEIVGYLNGYKQNISNYTIGKIAEIIRGEKYRRTNHNA